MKTLIVYTLIFLAMACSPLKKAEKSMKTGEYNTAMVHYKRALKPNDPVSNFKLAEAYRQSNRIAEATPYYQAAIRAGIANEMAHYYLIQALKAEGRYEEAKVAAEGFANKARDPEMVKLAHREQKVVNEIMGVKEKISYYRIKNLAEINTPQAEYAPVYNNGELFFTSNRKGGKLYKGTGTGFTDIFKVKTKGAIVELATLTALDPIINDPNVNEGSVTFSRDGAMMIYAKGNSGKTSGADNVDLYFARYRNGQWFTPRILPISDTNSWDSCPSLTADGTTLYFASNRPGGFGGTDIYTAKLNRRGRWVDIRNLGPEINTPGNETFPHVDENGTLYFASDGHPGLGQLDLFTAKREAGVIKVENMGAPINSIADDFGIFMYDPVRGFFTSNREEGKGDDDIYTFVNDDPDLKLVNYFLTGVTYTSSPDGQVALANTKVVLLDKNDKVVDEAFTGTDGKFRFRVYSEESYFLVGEKTEYFTTRVDFSTLGKSVDKSTLTEMVTDVFFEKDLLLDPIVLEKPIVLENIYYDLDKADIRSDAARELDKLVTVLKDNPEITIELSSHTDARADDAYNQDLSQRRAQSAVNYLVSKGVEIGRMVARGYGESRLIIKNAQTEEEHQVNRRTEFKVIRYNRKIEIEDNTDEEDRFFRDNDGIGN